MCGIAGFFSTRKINKINGRISRMLSVMYHRGPDADGKAVINDYMALGQRRLAIIDLDPRSDQPMYSDRGNIFVYNGEVYNYKEIKENLSYSFKTESDTEAILVGIDFKGIDWTLNQLNGMYAFSYYDVTSKTMYIARDRMGIKPLYYYAKDGLLVFASEIKSILSSGLVEAKLNESAIDEYLGNRYIRAPYTFFEDIYQVMPGHYLIVDSECNIKDVEYWHLPEQFNTNTNYDEVGILTEFGSMIEGAIRRRMISDVPLGTYLSGGVDSSLISAIAAINKTEPLETFTIGFPEMNEFSFAQEVADKYKTNHHELVMTNSNYFSMMEEVIGFKDAPLGVPNEIPLAQMSKELKKYITVVLSGEGADELMGGYGRIFRSAFDYQNHPELAGSFYDYFIGLYEYVPRAFRDRYIKSEREIREKCDNRIRAEFNDTSNEEAIFRFFHNYHVKGLLQRCDSTTMLASVEARVPFLDYTLIEYVYNSVPYDLKLNWRSDNRRQLAQKLTSNKYSEVFDTPKYLLKELAYKYLPIDVIERKKVGFPVPLDKWINDLAAEANEILKEADWLKKEKLDDIIMECNKIAHGGQILWMLINVELFRKMYFQKEWRY